jgi:hypothetical protein
MPTAVFDASYLTLRKRAKTLYAYNAANTAAVNAGASILREQPSTQMAEVIVVRRQGGCFCTNDAAGLTMTGNVAAGCGCTNF